MISKRVINYTLLLSFLLFFCFASLISADESCTKYYYGNKGDTYATVQTTKYPNTNERSIAWGLVINEEARIKYGPKVRVTLNRSRVNFYAINPPYKTPIQAPDYNFHGHLKNYQFIGQPGGGILKKGDRILLEFGIVSMNTKASDKLVISCTLD
ncbi:hypothetical protein ACIQXW_02770 [Lysinibacillus sp. NPDC097162]|uniref:hypothetical protein n=1 Tax=Lysinibacillus sp. NPDC097162 TaxID=3364140 RepID=UPI0038096505